MSNKSKGDAIERQAQKELEAAGWTVHRACRKAIFLGPGKMVTKGHDIFGADLIARKALWRTRYINVTTIENKSAKIKEFAKYPWMPEEEVEIWCRIPRKSWRKFSFLHDVDGGRWDEDEIENP